MTERILVDTIGEMDDRFIREAAPMVRKKKSWYRWTAVAAACLVLVAGLLALPMLQGGQFDGRYKYTFAQQEAAALVLRWEDKTLSERYLTMTFGETQYITRGMAIDATKLGAELGICKASGYDVYTDQTYHQEFAVYEIVGIQDEKLVAVCMEGTYYVFRMDQFDPPATLGELMEIYNLADNLPLTSFTDHSGRKETCYTLENDDVIWQILQECADAPVVEEDFRADGNYLSFTATSEALGIYKRVWYVTEDGYVKTNALDYGYVYFIGTEAAGQITDYALTNATETEPEPYTNFVAGTITEIGDGYILVNDAVLCWNERDGMEFEVLNTDPVFYRWFKYYNFQVGDVVFIQYRGAMEEGNVIPGAYSISKAILADGQILAQG